MTEYEVNLYLNAIKVEASNASAAVARAIEKATEDLPAQIKTISATPAAQRVVGFRGESEDLRPPE